MKITDGPVWNFISGKPHLLLYLFLGIINNLPPIICPDSDSINEISETIMTIQRIRSDLFLFGDGSTTANRIISGGSRISRWASGTKSVHLKHPVRC